MRLTDGMKQHLRKIFLIEKGAGKTTVIERARELRVEPASGTEIIRKSTPESLLAIQEKRSQTMLLVD